MITISRRELERAYRQHRKVCDEAQAQNSSHYLLLFYAVECGLKAVLMRRMNAADTNQLGESYNFGHDLNQGLDQLRVGHLKIPSTNILAKTTRPVEPKQINEVWRYGARLQPQEETNVVSRLRDIITWIEQEMVNR